METCLLGCPFPHSLLQSSCQPFTDLRATGSDCWNSSFHWELLLLFAAELFKLSLASRSACLGPGCHTWLLNSHCCCQSSQTLSWLAGRCRRRRDVKSDQSCPCGSWIFPRASQSPYCTSHLSFWFNSRNWQSHSFAGFITGGGRPATIVADKALDAKWPVRVFGFCASSHWAAHCCDWCRDGVGSTVAAFFITSSRLIYIIIQSAYY